MTLRHERAERHTIQVRKGDNVKVIAWERRGARAGRVLSIQREEKHRGSRARRHHQAAHASNPSKNIKGGIVEKEAGINVSER